MPERVMMGWGRSPLDAACDFLLKKGSLSGVRIVTPGARAGRLLLGLLIDRGGAVSPPEFLTPGGIVRDCVGDIGVPAGAIAQREAWKRAMRAVRAEDVSALIPLRPESDGEVSGFASMLERCHSQLIGEGLRFTEVAERAEALLETPEADRWRSAAVIQQQYARELAAIGLVDDGIAGIEALERASRAVGPREYVLVGVPEIPGNARRALGLAGVRVTSLVFAPESHADRFDELGCVDVDRWHEERVHLREEQIRYADLPRDQAEAAMDEIAKLDGRYAAHEIVIGVPDEAVVPYLEVAAERYAGVEARAAAGRSMTGAPIFQLLLMVMRAAEEGSFSAYARLARHADVEWYMSRKLGAAQRDVLAAMDEYEVCHLPGRGDWLTSAIAPGAKQIELLELARRTLRQLLGPVVRASASAGDVLSMLERLYAGRKLSRDDADSRETIAEAEAVKEAIVEVAALPEGWMRGGILRAVIDVLSSAARPNEGSADAIELLGWLEVPLDTSPVAIITGVNDGMLPESFGSDALLPDGLRTKLRVPSSRSRLARDVYLTNLIVESRPEVRLITGRRGADGDPLLPSRLLFKAEPGVVVERVRRVTARGAGGGGSSIEARLRPGGINEFLVMPWQERAPVNSMRVTAFKMFLQSPYWFYLTNVLKLDEVEIGEPEMDPMVFGQFVHGALERWGTSDAKDLTEAGRIRGALMDQLSTLASERFGSTPPVAVSMQIEIARLRLTEFAEWQARHRGAGWRIDRVEGDTLHADLPGLDPAFDVRGKIDRIDRNERTGEVAVIDYKTSDSADSPRKTHGKAGNWKDLQLPLYRHLAARFGLPEDPSKVVLAYVTLPKRPGGVDLRPGKWTPEDLADADRAAREIASRARSGDMRDLGPEPPGAGTLAALCGTAFYGALGAREDMP